MPGPPVAYPGIDPVTINSTGAGSAGVIVNDGTHGRASIPGVVTGNNDVTADNVAAADQAEQNSIQWLFWRTLDIWSGGDYRAASGQLLLNNPITFYGTIIFEAALAIAPTGTLTMLAGSIATFGGPAVFNGAVTQNGSYTKGSVGAWTSLRKSATGVALTAFAPEQVDTLWCYATSADYLITLTDPNVTGVGATPLPQGIRCTLVVPGAPSISYSGAVIQALNTHIVTVHDHNGTSLGVFVVPVAGALKSLTIETVSVSGTIVWDIVANTLFVA